MAKPIFLVGLPYMANHEQVQEVQKNLENKLTDYYPLVYMQNQSEVQFQVFYEKDFNEIEFDELKKMVFDSLKTVAPNGS